MQCSEEEQLQRHFRLQQQQDRMGDEEGSLTPGGEGDKDEDDDDNINDQDQDNCMTRAWDP